MERESGYYWVKDPNPDDSGNHWYIGEYDTDLRIWYLTGSSKWFYDKDFIEIDERRIERS